jgi:hypothetical protein
LAAASNERLARVVAGAFDSASLPTGLLGFRATGLSPVIEGCCTCSGLRGLCLAWEHAIEERAGGVWVHLGLSRDSPWAEVLSFEPEVGQMDVRLHAAHHLRVRVPRWVPRDALTVLVADAPVSARWEGDYLRFDDLAAGQTVSLRYPLIERAEAEQVGAERLAVHWRGGTVVAVVPPGPGLEVYTSRQRSRSSSGA